MNLWMLLVFRWLQVKESGGEVGGMEGRVVFGTWVTSYLYLRTFKFDKYLLDDEEEAK